MDNDTVITTIHPGAITVREETRHAWNALRVTDKVPSVRAVYAVVGGAYNTVCGECRVLRAEESLPGSVALAGIADPTTPHTPLEALTQRVERLEQQLALFEEIRQLGQQCVRDRRTWKALLLWAQRTVGQTQSPLTALLAWLERSE